jgi:ABC-2 type transport system ATP-binding protein
MSAVPSGREELRGGAMTPEEAQAIAVRVRDLTVQFGTFTAVDHISFEVRTGEIFGFLGANGAGKTTTIRCLCGLLIPTTGNVVIGGIDVGEDPRGVKSIVGYMSQKFTLYDDMTIEENLIFAAALRKLDDAFFQKRKEALYELINLSEPPTTMVRDLPGGVLQQVALIAATLHDPKIIFLDEPTAGVTPAHRALFWKLIKQLAGEGRTVFVTTHYMDEAEQCHRIALMRAGEVVALDSPRELKRQTFPEPVYELTPPEAAPAGWLLALQGQPFVQAADVYGMRYHVRVTDKAAWESYAAALAGFGIERIEPTLEDVFIRVVEGMNR